MLYPTVVFLRPNTVTSSDRKLISNFFAASKELWSDGRSWILLSVSAGWFLSFGVRNMFPALVPFFIREFNITLSMAGLLLTTLWASYAIGQFPGGVLGDRFGERTVLVFSMGFATVTVLAVSISSNLALLFAGTAGFGFATALYAPTRFTIFTNIYSDRAGTAIGLTMAAGNLGNSILPPLAGLIAGFATWRLGFGYLLPFFSIITVALWVAVPKRTSSSASATEQISIRQIRNTIGRIGGDGIPVIVAIQILNGLVYQGFVGFYPVYLIEVKNFTPAVAATLFGLFFATGVIIQPLSGLSQDHFGSRRTLMGLLGVFMGGLLLLWYTSGLLSIALVTILLSSRTGAGVVNNVYIADAIPEDIQGTGLGLLRSSWILIGSLSPIIVGFLGDLGFIQEAFLLMAVLVGAALLLTTRIPTGIRET